MKKRFIYEFSGKIWVDAKNKDEAEDILIESLKNKKMNKYIIEEYVYEVDQFYVSDNLEKREKDWGSFFHPVLECDEYSKYKKRYNRYGIMLKNFLHGKIDKDELIKRMEEADTDNDKSKDSNQILEFYAHDLEGELKTVRHFYVGEK
jgi:hypothetical protein